MEALSGAKWFLTLDIKSGCWQVELEANNKEKTAFSIGTGLWQFTVMPFISQEIQSLLDKGAITSATSHSKNCFSTIFTVPKKGGELHPMMNLKGLNRFIPHVHFKKEGIQSMRDDILP